MAKFATRLAGQAEGDYRGRRTSVTEHNGKTATYPYDDADHVLTVTDADNN